MNLLIYSLGSILVFLIITAIIGGACFGVIAIIYGSIKWLINQFKQEKIGVLVRGGSAWLGVHYSKYCKRVCINILPCITLWIGNKPSKL